VPASAERFLVMASTDVRARANAIVGGGAPQRTRFGGYRLCRGDCATGSRLGTWEIQEVLIANSGRGGPPAAAGCDSGGGAVAGGGIGGPRNAPPDLVRTQWRPSRRVL